MDNIAGRKSSLNWAVNLSVIFLVLLWIIPTVGLLVSSFRDRDQISASGWWLAPFSAEQAYRARTSTEATPEGDIFVVTGNVFEESEATGTLSAFGVRSIAPGEFTVGTVADLGDGESLSIAENGDYEFRTPEEPGRRGQRIYFTAETPPEFTLENYETVLGAGGMAQAFINTLTVTIPATIIPILIAAFAAYALAWMQFPMRGLLIALVVGLLVVPLQLALVPLLRLHTEWGIGRSFLGVWMAHTGFGLPLAIYLLRNYMVGLPRDIIESAKVDGATDFQVFTKIVLPLSFPALASFAIFQFLWTWNDLLVAKVFLPDGDQAMVMTRKIADDLLGSRGGDWGILASAAFVSIAVPLLVFFTMQRYLVRGLLAGSVK
ncbi:carbohydrate ABC transporter permease [Jannaschia aquimarina]|uniref:AraQ protein n=1 Tax=Jannaschia aquimarina TaxID=935700 RepID=A0A0D1ERC5_9RHOB|nr:carbohydrate ABC transporter permease [Jannaschia aquimarina]KIT18180.1 L-arabinose transport system permease protein AraQ [Jannaschia aquimarina]SNT40379.1 maltose ABC transporter membrane protein /trehalose ABC transporter membrane protein /sucrose ABC transporter membrane protein [Jannaschia aquimarina]